MKFGQGESLCEWIEGGREAERGEGGGYATEGNSVDKGDQRNGRGGGNDEEAI